MGTFTLGKTDRLKRKLLWEGVFSRGSQVKSFPIRLYFLKTCLPDPVPIQAGFAVPKRSIRKAVNRNRIKRLMREAYRLEKQNVHVKSEHSYALVFLYLGKEPVSFYEIQKAVKMVLSKFAADEKEIKS